MAPFFEVNLHDNLEKMTFQKQFFISPKSTLLYTYADILDVCQQSFNIYYLFMCSVSYVYSYILLLWDMTFLCLWKCCPHFLNNTSNDSGILIFLYRYFVRLKLVLKIFILILLYIIARLKDMYYNIFYPIFIYFTYLCCIIMFARDSGSILTNRCNCWYFSAVPDLIWTVFSVSPESMLCSLFQVAAN